MKLLHTSDWHIGKLVQGQHMTMDQAYILDQFLAYLENDKPDVILIAGDIYDRSIPPVEATVLLDRILSEIVLNLKIPVLVISGNHDSPDRLGFGQGMLESCGLHIRTDLTRVTTPVTLNDLEGPVDFYLIPYMEVALVRHYYDDPTIKCHDDAMRRILSDIKKVMNPKRRNVCLAHAYLMGADKDRDESVRPLSIGGTEFVDASLFEPFDYVALGHLHRPQRVMYDKIRYAGSLLKYSFGEANQEKGMYLVELQKDQLLTCHQIKLPILRDMRVIKGPLEELVSMEVVRASNPQDYIQALLTDSGELVDPLQVLRSVYPNLLGMMRERDNQVLNDQAGVAARDFAKMEPLRLFEDFYEAIAGQSMSVDSKDKLVELMADLLKKERVEG